MSRDLTHVYRQSPLGLGIGVAIGVVGLLTISSSHLIALPFIVFALCIIYYEWYALKNRRLEDHGEFFRFFDWRGKLLVEAMWSEVESLEVASKEASDDPSLNLITARGKVNVQGLQEFYKLQARLTEAKQKSEEH